jgi:hypothetical protein
MIGGNRGKTVQAYKKSRPASLFLAPLHRTLNHVAKTRGAERDCFRSDPMPSWACANEYPSCVRPGSTRVRDGFRKPLRIVAYKSSRIRRRRSLARGS